MNYYNPSDNELNAYVDGELDAVTRAQIAHAIAADPQIAQKVARLTALKATLPDAMPALPEISLNARLAPANHNGPFGRSMALIASILVAIAIGSWTVYQSWRTPAPVVSWRMAADEQHRIWTQKSKSHTMGTLQPAAVSADGAPIPDLSSAQLTLNAFDRIKLGSFEAFRLGYSGTRGCRLSLFLLNDDAPSPQSGFAWSRGTESAEWHAGERRYVLLSIGMDVARFKHLAEKLEAFTRKPNRFDAETRQQFARAKKAARPCIG
ncbi:MAG: anti-sigma factor family protein [Hyphomicrobiaceae bacterium]